MLAVKSAVLRREMLSPPAAVFDTVWPAAAVEPLARDATLYAEGDVARSWYRLLVGTVRVVRGLVDGRRHVSEFVFPGQFFGIEPGPHRPFSAEAVEASTVLAYPIEAIEQRMAQDHLARRTVRNLLAERLSAAQERAVALGSLNAGERVASFLAAMASRHHTGRLAELPMGRADIADHLGLTVETLSRLLTALKSRRAIRMIAVNRIELLDPAVFAGLAEPFGTPLRACN